MSSELESRTPHFGLRDFLFYLVPGGVTLLAAAVVAGVTPADVRDWGGVGGSIVGLFVAYSLGQVLYPLTYVFRRARLFRWRFAPRGSWSDEPLEFAHDHLKALEQHPAYYSAVIFRDRSFARFALAMLVPSILLGVAVAVRTWSLSPLIRIIALLVGVLAAAGFYLRFRKYDLRYHREVLLCMGKDVGPIDGVEAMD